MALDNHDRPFRLRNGNVEAIAIPFWSEPGFAIPLIYQDQSSNAAYVQRVDFNRKIVGYDVFLTGTRKKELEASCRTRIGGPEVFALIDPAGHPYAGTKSALTPIIKRWVKEIRTPLLQLSFARFCGERKLAESAAARAVEAKEVEFRNRARAARWFVSSVVVSELISILAKDAGGEALQAVYEDRVGALATVISGDSSIEVQLPPDFGRRKRPYGGFYRDQLRDLLELTRAATGYAVDIVYGSKGEANVFEQDVKDTERLRREVAAPQRQEQRVSRMLIALIEEPKIAMEVLANLHDRAMHADKVFADLRQTLAQSSLQGGSMPSFVAAHMPSVVSSSFPMNKGYLLLELAKALARYEGISEVIRQIVDKSRSIYVERYRAEIIAQLSSGKD